MPRIGQFNDAFRDGMKGNVFDDRSKGFINGDYQKKIDVLRGIVGGIDYSNYINHWGKTEPNQVVNYIEVHDNHTLFDKLRLSSDVYEENHFLRRQIFGTSILLLSQGIPFIHSGQEFMRTKYLEHNTYNLGDEINQVDWERKEIYIDLVNYTQELIDLRKKHPSFRMLTSEEIKNHMFFLSTDQELIAYIIKGYEEAWPTILVIHNASQKRKTVTLPFKKHWKIVANNQIIDEDGIFDVVTKQFVVNKVCTMVAYSKE
jgi:pullulanase